jgi:pSer/pThr/pTyr-binding forkhead associated (FHA) protein
MRVSVYNILIPENSEISIGRNHHSQVIFRDISVSRNHCYLIYRHGSLYIQDKKSKFGTLVCPKKGF